jgi:hypothetical protein
VDQQRSALNRQKRYYEVRGSQIIYSSKPGK